MPSAIENVRGIITIIISDGINGCLYNPEEDDQGENSLIGATKRILQNKDKKDKMRLAAREEAEKWDWNQATLQLKNFYINTLNKN